MWLYEIYKLLVYIVDSILTYLELGLYVIYTHIYSLASQWPRAFTPWFASLTGTKNSWPVNAIPSLDICFVPYQWHKLFIVKRSLLKKKTDGLRTEGEASWWMKHDIASLEWSDLKRRWRKEESRVDKQRLSSKSSTVVWASANTHTHFNNEAGRFPEAQLLHE